MTTFQDPPPQSRRAVRQSERGETAERVVTPPNGFAQFPPPQVPASPQYFPGSTSTGDIWDTTSRRAAQLPTAMPRPDAAAPVAGRRSAGTPQTPPSGGMPAPVHAPVAEPLSYATQASAPQPIVQQTPVGQPLVVPSASEQHSAELATYRMRDFSPEAQRATQAEYFPVAPTPNQPMDVSYYTENRPAYSPETQRPPVSQVPPQIAQPQQSAPSTAPAPFSAPAPVAAEYVSFLAPAPGEVHAMADRTGEQTLTRRELRAMLAAQEAAAAGGTADTAWVGLQSPVGDLQPLSHHQSPVAAAYYDPPPFTLSPPEVPSYQGAPPPAAADLTPAQSAPAPVVASQPVQPASYEAMRFSEALPGTPALPGTHSFPNTEASVTTAIAEFDSIANPNQPITGSNRPVGHWSTQADLDDLFQVPETTINRRISSGSTATNALVLPSIPGGNDIRGPLTGTGEIILTGSIHLPHTLAATGMTGQLEHDGIDSLFDLHDSEVITTDSQPVRAVRAVSTHPSGHGVTHTIKPKGTRALTALLIAAASMAVVVAGLLIAAFALHIF
jgi:hypothetical protein